MLGQDGRTDSGWVAGVAGLLAVVLLAAVGVAALRSDTASADTVLSRGADARLVLADGSSRAAVEGERVPRGATVAAGPSGAELTTRDREVHLGGDTRVTVVDGARQELRSGFVMVDASEAPGLELRTAAATVTTQDDSLVRVDSGPLVRVGVLRGDAAAVRAASRRATSDVPTYFQVQVAPGSLPGAVTPFVLTPGDAYERDLASELVRADEDLTALAARLDTDGRVGQVVMAALTEQVAAPVPAPGTRGSEGTLGYLLATASTDRGDVAARYTRVRELRETGGSWGVVAAIVDAEVSRVSAALGALLEPGAVPVVAGGPLDLDAVLDPAFGPAPSAQDPAPAPQPTRRSGDGGGGGQQPTAPPSPSPGPLDPVEDVIQDVVDTVLDLVSPSPTPVRPPAPVTVPPAPPPPVLPAPPVPPLPPLPLPTLAVPLPG